MPMNKVQGSVGVYNVRTRGILPSRSCLLWLWQTGLQWLLPHLSLPLIVPHSVAPLPCDGQSFCYLEQILDQPPTSFYRFWFCVSCSPFSSSWFRKSWWKCHKQPGWPCRNLAWCDSLKLRLRQMAWPEGAWSGRVVHTQLWIPGKDKIPREEQVHHLTLQSHGQGLCAAVTNSLASVHVPYNHCWFTKS